MVIRRTPLLIRSEGVSLPNVAMREDIMVTSSMVMTTVGASLVHVVCGCPRREITSSGEGMTMLRVFTIISNETMTR